MNSHKPLASQLRPTKLSEFIGQKEVVGPNTWFHQALKEDQVPSLLLWGPPGSGKTTLAYIIASETKADFIEFSATTSGLTELREVISQAGANLRLGEKTFLFIDEIHRWNKTQQDALLPQVEQGNIILIGATTENPSFAIRSALLSRLKVLVLEPLTSADLEAIIKQALGKVNFKLSSKQISLVAHLAKGDARRALGIVESLLVYKKKIDEKIIKEIANQPNLVYDKTGDEHYNLISALHKSMRGGDADASLYYLARMLEAGEDPLYIARRLIRFASEDVGLANNSALLLANACYDACAKIGLPEANINLAHTVVYLAKSKKSISAYEGYMRAQAEVKNSGNLAVPLHLRNAPTKFLEEMGYAKDYKYSPKEDDSEQDYLPKEIIDKKFLF